MKNKLTESLIVSASNLFELYRSAHAYHINVMGPTFKQDHDFLSDLYNSFNAHFDSVSELIRIEDDFLPGDFASKSIISSPISTSRSDMLSDIARGIEICIASLKSAHKEATKTNSIGTFTTLETVIEAMSKSLWMVKSSI